MNVLGKKAAAKVESCTIRDCSIGIASYSKAKVYTAGTFVTNTTTEAVSVTSRGYASLTGGWFASDGYGLHLTDGGQVDGIYTEFKNSEYGVFIEKDGANLPGAEFVQCDIDSNEVGAQISETNDVEFDTCNIRVSAADGVYLLSDADVTFTDCIIGSNDDSAIRCDDSSPEIIHCDIENNAGGVTSQNEGFPVLRRNKIWNNNNGLGLVDDGSAEVEICGADCESCEDANSFKNNTYHVSNLTESPLYAACNYWGRTTPLPSKFYGDVNYEPYLSGDPYSAMVQVAGPPESQTIDTGLPKVYRLAGNMPNPFNPVTTIRYDVPAPGGHVKLRIYNVQGQLVKVLLDDAKPAGFHRVVWNGVDQRGNGVATGIYFVEMIAPRFRATHKILMLK